MNQSTTLVLDDVVIEEVEIEVGNEEDKENDVPIEDAGDDDFIFMKVLSNYGKVLLEKAQTPTLRLKKKQATEMISQQLSSLGILYSDAQIKKKLENLKSRLKKKIDVKKTGNVPITLKPHERLLADMLNYTTNPSISRLSCNFSL